MILFAFITLFRFHFCHFVAIDVSRIDKCAAYSGLTMWYRARCDKCWTGQSKVHSNGYKSELIKNILPLATFERFSTTSFCFQLSLSLQCNACFRCNSTKKGHAVVNRHSNKVEMSPNERVKNTVSIETYKLYYMFLSWFVTSHCWACHVGNFFLSSILCLLFTSF